MPNFYKILNNFLIIYGNSDTEYFKKEFESLLISISNDITRYDAYKILIDLPNDFLSDDNSDYLSDVVADIRGHSSKIIYKFKGDPDLTDEEMLAYVRQGSWKYMV